jgi:hypothetical protein
MGGDPFLCERDYNSLKDLEKSEARHAAKDFFFRDWAAHPFLIKRIKV